MVTLLPSVLGLLRINLKNISINLLGSGTMARAPSQEDLEGERKLVEALSQLDIVSATLARCDGQLDEILRSWPNLRCLRLSNYPNNGERGKLVDYTSRDVFPIYQLESMNLSWSILSYRLFLFLLGNSRHSLRYLSIHSVTETTLSTISEIFEHIGSGTNLTGLIISLDVDSYPAGDQNMDLPSNFFRSFQHLVHLTIDVDTKLSEGLLNGLCELHTLETINFVFETLSYNSIRKFLMHSKGNLKRASFGDW